MRWWIFKVGVVVFGLILVFVSMARASYEILAKEIGDNNLKNRYLEFVINFGDGQTQPANYKFPEVSMLPNSPFYGFKKIRDWIWVNLASGTNKAQIVLLMADKKMVEASDLFSNGQGDLAIEAGNEAIDKLKYASDILDTVSQSSNIKLQLRKQIFLAGHAYKKLATNGTETFDMEQGKYSDLIKKIDNWNDQQEKNSHLWQE